MNKAYLTVGIILLSIFTFGILNFIQNYSTGNELDYYLLKETTQASMGDAVVPSTFASNGTLRIDKEMFVESFIKRFANSVDDSRDYDIQIFDINEVPPKVSIKVVSKNESLNPAGQNGGNAEIVTQIDGVLMSNYKKDNVATSFKANKQ